MEAGSGRVLSAIYELTKVGSKQRHTTHDQIVERTGLESDVVDAYIEALENAGCISATKMHAGNWLHVALIAKTKIVMMNLEYYDKGDT